MLSYQKYLSICDFSNFKSFLRLFLSLKKLFDLSKNKLLALLTLSAAFLLSTLFASTLTYMFPVFFLLGDYFASIFQVSSGGRLGYLVGNLPLKCRCSQI
jgi:hypothetical protein